MQRHVTAPSAELMTLLRTQQEQLALAWARLLLESEWVPPVTLRLRHWCSESLGVIIAWLETGSEQAIDHYLQLLVPECIQHEVSIEQAVESLLLSKEVVSPIILAAALPDLALMTRWMSQFDAGLRRLAACMSGEFAAITAQQLREQERRTALMLEAAQTASSSPAIEQVLPRIAHSMAAALNTRDCGIYLLDGEQQQLVLRATTHALVEQTTPDVFPLNGTADPLLAAVLARRVPVIFPDDLREREPLSYPPLLALPIIAAGERLLGVAIVVGADVQHRFSEAQVALAWGIAHAVALALDNAQLFSQQQRQLAESESLQRITAALLGQMSLNDVLDIVCREAQQLTGARGSLVLLSEDDPSTLRIAHAIQAETSGCGPFPTQDLFAGRAIAVGAPVVINDPGSVSVTTNVFGKLESLLAVPLRIADSTIGAIDLINKPDGFASKDERIVSRFADQAAIAIQNARLHKQIEQLTVIGERQRLAHNLHDSVAQLLYSLCLYAKAAADALRDDDRETTHAHLGEIRQIAQDALSEMRLLIFNLRSPVLEQQGLIAALQTRLEAVEVRASLKAELRHEGDERLAYATKEALYHIAQEALNNVLRHARAQHVTVYVHFGDTSTLLEVIDDGQGFDPTQVQGGLGLHGMQERIQQLHGSVTIQSAPGAGTQIRVEVPQ